jgi:hypothetical protein
MICNAVKPTWDPRTGGTFCGCYQIMIIISKNVSSNLLILFARHHDDDDDDGLQRLAKTPGHALARQLGREVAGRLLGRAPWSSTGQNHAFGHFVYFHEMGFRSQ